MKNCFVLRSGILGCGIRHLVARLSGIPLMLHFSSMETDAPHELCLSMQLNQFKFRIEGCICFEIILLR